MPAWQRRVVHGVSLWLLTGLLAASPARAALHFDFVTAFDNTYRPGAWTHLTVRVRGSARAGQALLQLRVNCRRDTRVYSRSVLLGDGAVDQRFCIPFVHPYLGTGDQMDVQLVQDGRVVATQHADLGLAYADPAQFTMVCLNQDHGGLTHLNGANLGAVHERWVTSTSGNVYGSYSYPMSGGSGSGRQSVPCRVMYPGPEVLPDAGAAYDSVDAVVLGDMPIDSISDVQWSALRDWVRSGGLLVISGGPDVGRYRRRQIADLLPVQPAGVQPSASLSPLASAGGQACGLSLPAVTGAAVPDAAVIAATTASPLVSVRRYGTGAVVFAAFDLFAPAFRAWPGQRAFWASVVTSSQAADGPGRRLEQMAQSGAYSSSGARRLGDVLAGLSSARPPSFLFIGGFLLLYIVCLVPLNYLLLRKWDRKELAWITAPVIVVVFTVGSYTIGAAYKGRELKVRYAAVVECCAGRPEAWVRTLTTVCSPRRARYTLSCDDPGAIADEVDMTGAPSTEGGDGLAVVRGDHTVLPDFLVNMWDQRTILIGSRADLPGVVTAVVRPVGGLLARVEVQNGTGQLLRRCAITSPLGLTRIGDLRPGQRATVQVVYQKAGRWTGGQFSSGASTAWSPQAYAPGAGERSQDLQDEIAAALGVGFASGGGGLLPVFTFIGWADKPLATIRLESESPSVTGSTLLVAYLPGTDGRMVKQVPQAAAGQSGAYSGGPRSSTGGSGPQLRYGAATRLNSEAYALAQRGNLDGALRVANRAHSLAPQDANIMDTVAEMHQRRKEYRQAASWYEKALASSGRLTMTETRYKYGQTLEALKRRQEAIRQYRLAAADAVAPHGALARKRLASLGVRSAFRPQTVVSAAARITSMPNGARRIDGPHGTVVIPPVPTTPSGSRSLRIPVQGGAYIVQQTWNRSPSVHSDSLSVNFVPAGGPARP